MYVPPWMSGNTEDFSLGRNISGYPLFVYTEVLIIEVFITSHAPFGRPRKRESRADGTVVHKGPSFLLASLPNCFWVLKEGCKLTFGWVLL